MKHDPPSAEDLGRLARHRLTLPATLWALAVLAACLAVLFDDTAPADAQATASASTVSPR